MVTNHAAAVVAGDGCRLASRLDGPGDAPVLVLSSSLGATHALWDRVLPLLTGRFRVLRHDTRGHGGSDAPAGDYALSRLGRDVLDLLDAWSIERAHVCGISLGGMVAQWLGAEAPGRVDRLVLANTAAFMGPPASWEQRMAAVRSGGLAAVVDGTVERWLTAPFRAREPEVTAQIRAMILATDPAGYLGCCAAIRDMDLRPSTSHIAAPTLLIAGAQDVATPPASLAAIAGALSAPSATVTFDAAHLTCVEEAEGFARAVLDFLR